MNAIKQTVSNLSSLFVALVAAATLVACVDAPDEGSKDDILMVWEVPDTTSALSVTEMTRPDVLLTLASPDFTLATGEDLAGLCECADHACMQDWIAENTECGVCVLTECGDGSRAGGCVPCAD